MMWISIIVFLIIFFVLQLSAIIKHSKSSFSFENSLKLDDLCLIIPFKNERKNLIRFLNWIKTQDLLPREIILVNDHSSDINIEEVNEVYQDINGLRFIELDKEQNGKKKAIRKAIELTNCKYILTMDADVIPADQYFETLNDYKAADLNVLPVKMAFDSSKPFTRFAAFEYNLLQSLNFLFSRYFVLTASGANLLFSKTSFYQSDDIEHHVKIPSGDDHYLLRAFQKNKMMISVINNPKLSVRTESVKDFGSYWKQRSRWLGKLFKYSQITDWIAGVFLVGFILIGFVSLITTLYFGNYIAFGLIYSLLTLNYMLPIFFFENTFSLKTFLESLIFVIYYPVVFTLIILRAFTFPNEKWK